jgi:hypothetical protein
LKNHRVNKINNSFVKRVIGLADLTEDVIYLIEEIVDGDE